MPALLAIRVHRAIRLGMSIQIPSQSPAYIDSETGTLREVVLGIGEGFHSTPPEIINSTMPAYYGTADAPTAHALERQLSQFHNVLMQAGVTVHRPVQLDAVPDQVCPRDLGFVIGDRFYWCRMKFESRRIEQQGVFHITEMLPADRVVTPPEDIVLEGGDVLVDTEAVFVGVGQRSSRSGAEWLHSELRGIREVVPVELQGEAVLHLDCAFSPVGHRTALVFPDGFKGGLPDAIRDRYDNLIEVTIEEQAKLATNVLSIDPQTVVSRSDSHRVNDGLRSLGFDVREVEFDEPPKTGGSFRCSTLAIRRDPLD